MIDVAGMFRIALSKWYVFAISVFCCCTLAFLYSRVHQRDFEVKANIVITQEDPSGLSPMSAVFGSSALVDDEVYAVSSHTVLCKVAKALNINQMQTVHTGFLRNVNVYPEEPVTLRCLESIPDTLTTGLSFKYKVGENGLADITVKAKRDKVADLEGVKLPATIKTPYGVFVLEPTKYFPKGEELKGHISFTGYDDAAEALAKSIVIDIASRKSNVIEMSMTSPNTTYAKAVLNSIIEQYNLRGLEIKNQSNLKTLDFINGRLELLSRDLLSSESTIEDFKKDNGIVDIYSEVTYQMTKRGQLETQIITLETQLQIIDMIRDFISNPKNQYELIPVTLVGSGSESTTSSHALEAYNELLLKRITLLQEAHGSNAALRTINGQIESLRNNILETIKQNEQSISAQLRQMRDQMGSTASRLGEIPTQEREFRDIKRQQAIKEQLYLFLLKQREETSILLANTKDKGEIIDQAYAVNTPLGLGTLSLLIVGGFIGLILGFVYLQLSRLLRTKFESREELEQLTDVPVLGEMCNDHSGETLVVRPGKSTSAVELFGLLRTNLQFILSGRDDKVVLVTSTIAGEGKSFVSVNLAASLAMLKKRVVLIGLDIRNPKLSEYLGLSDDHRGATEFFANESVRVDDIIRVNPLGNGMDIITAGPIPPNPAELLAGQRLDELFAVLRQLYDFIIVDSAPVGMVSDTFVLARVADATVYVTRLNYSTTREVRFFNEVYANKRLPKMSLVANGSHAKKGYGYGYGRENSK